MVTTLERKQAEFAELEQVYLQKYEQAKNDLGAARLGGRRRASSRCGHRTAEQQHRWHHGRHHRWHYNCLTGRGGGGTVNGSTGSGSGAGTPAVSVPAVVGQGRYRRVRSHGPARGALQVCGRDTWGCLRLLGAHQVGLGPGRCVSDPTRARASTRARPHVPKDQAQPGDLVFYYSPIGHVGIYIGGGQMVHAPQAGDVVSVATVHWNKVVGVGRPG